VWHNEACGTPASRTQRKQAIALEIERLLAQKKDSDERLKKLQKEYEKVTGEPYHAK
jgi:chaperonin cofactor prefoldin